MCTINEYEWMHPARLLRDAERVLFVDGLAVGRDGEQTIFTRMLNGG